MVQCTHYGWEIHGTGSMATAQRRLRSGRSYFHRWKLLAVMSRSFSSPHMEPIDIGKHGGGAKPTREGCADILVVAKLACLAQCGIAVDNGRARQTVATGPQSRAK